MTGSSPMAQSTQPASAMNPSEAPRLHEQEPKLMPSGVSTKDPYRLLILFIFLVVVMLTWPWLFLGYVWQQGGLPASISWEFIGDAFPQDVSFIVTFTSSILAVTVGYLFSASVAFFAKKRVSSNSTQVSRIDFLERLKGRRPVWNLSFLGFMSLFYIFIFLAVGPGFTTLLRPIQFHRSGNLTGSELDFSATDPACISWFGRNAISKADCDRKILQNDHQFSYTDCLGQNQLFDVLGSGRINMIYDNGRFTGANDSTITFTQLEDSHFASPIHGVLPTGPNGVDALTEVNVPLDDIPFLSYNYTLGLQGLASNVSCTYGKESPILFTNATTGWSQYSGSCPSSSGQLSDATSYLIPTSNKSLGFWACSSPQPDTFGETYLLYFRGDNDYATTIGNITCNVTSMQPAVFPVTYTSQGDRFTTGKSSSKSPNMPDTNLTQLTISKIRDFVQESQGVGGNFVAETLFGYLSAEYKTLPGQAMAQDGTSLRLWGLMVQGMLEYEISYTRLIYAARLQNSTDQPPPSCMRDFKGNVSYALIGWKVKGKNAAYLIPLTLVNLTSLVMLLRAISIREKSDSSLPVSHIGGGNVTVPTPTRIIPPRPGPIDTTFRASAFHA